MKKYFFIILATVFLSCKSNSNNNISTNDIKSTPVDYLEKKGWLSPKDMDILDKAMPQQTAGMDSDERKEAIIKGLKELNVPELEINRLMEKLLNERTIHHEWDYDYIRSRFKIYKSEMKNDSVWSKIYNESQNK